MNKVYEGSKAYIDIRYQIDNAFTKYLEGGYLLGGVRMDELRTLYKQVLYLVDSYACKTGYISDIIFEKNRLQKKLDDAFIYRGAEKTV